MGQVEAGKRALRLLIQECEALGDVILGDVKALFAA